MILRMIVAMNKVSNGMEVGERDKVWMSLVQFAYSSVYRGNSELDVESASVNKSPQLPG